MYIGRVLQPSFLLLLLLQEAWHCNIDLLRAADILSAAYLMVNAPVMTQSRIRSTLLTFHTNQAARSIDQAELIQLLETVMARLIEASDPTDCTCHAVACFKGIFALPAVQELPCEVMISLLAGPIAAGKAGVVHLLCGKGPGAYGVGLPLHRLDGCGVGRLLAVAVGEFVQEWQGHEKVDLREQVLNRPYQLSDAPSADSECIEDLIGYVMKCISVAADVATGASRSCNYEDTCLALDSLVGLVM